MIKKMRLKFIAITMGALILLLVSILISTNLVMSENNERNTNGLLNDLMMNDGILPNQPNQPMAHPPTQQDINEFFSVKLDFDNNIIEIISKDPNIDGDTVEDLISIVVINEKNKGKIDDMNYIVGEKNYGKIIAFANQSIQNFLLDDLRRISYIIGTISIGILLIIVFFLSKLVTKPIEIAFEKQKRFVSDSGHELKTPLSILSANADMMEMEFGENQWLNQIKQQSKRMNKLIHELLTLAKTDDMKSNIEFLEFNLSQTILNTVLPLEVIAFEQQKEIECNVFEDVYFNGNEKSIKEMIEALMDNAIKYSNENSAIVVKLFTKGSKKIIEIQNQGQEIAEKEKGKLFEKFYRIDDSRARETGGYGLGLSIVKNIVDMHNSKIEIDSDFKGNIVFRIILTD